MFGERSYTQGHFNFENSMTPTALPTLLNKAAVCTLLSCSPRCLEIMVKNDDFPPPVRLGKHVYWSELAVNRWLQEAFTRQETWNSSIRASASLSSRNGVSGRLH